MAAFFRKRCLLWLAGCSALVWLTVVLLTYHQIKHGGAPPKEDENPSSDLPRADNDRHQQNQHVDRDAQARRDAKERRDKDRRDPLEQREARHAANGRPDPDDKDAPQHPRPSRRSRPPRVSNTPPTVNVHAVGVAETHPTTTQSTPPATTSLTHTPAVAAHNASKQSQSREFSDRKPPSDLYDKLFRNQNPPDCNKVQKIACDVSSSFLGFGYQLHQIAKCVLIALKGGKTAVMWPPKFGRYAPEVSNAWDEFFLPISTCTGPAPAADMGDGGFKNWVPSDVHIPDEIVTKEIFVVGTAEAYIMRPNERMRKLLDAQALPSDIGIHVRRTDKITMQEAWSHELEQYMQAVDRIVNPQFNFHSAYGRVYHKRVFVASDDSAILNEAKSKFKHYEIAHGSGADVDRYSKEGLEQFLVELFSLINTQYFVGTFSSQVSRIVYEIYHTKYLDAYHRAWSLDDPWYADGYDLAFVNDKSLRATLSLELPEFPGVVPPTTFYDKLVALQNPADCSKAQLVSCDVSTSFLGFGYQLHQITKCMLMAYKEGKTAVLFPNKLGKYGPECNNDWTCFFEPISSCSGPAPRMADSGGFKDWAPSDVDIPSSVRNPGIFAVGTVEKYVLRPSARLKARLEGKLPKADFGVHIRRTDKITSKEAWSHTVEQYMQAVDRIAMPHWNYHSAYERNFDKSVFVASDDAAVLSEAQNRYPQYKILHGNGAAVERYSQEGLDSFLEELFTLAQADYFVGTFSSQVSRIVYELYHTRYMDAHEYAWSLDDPWYGDGYSLDFPKGT